MFGCEREGLCNVCRPFISVVQDILKRNSIIYQKRAVIYSPFQQTTAILSGPFMQVYL